MHNIQILVTNVYTQLCEALWLKNALSPVDAKKKFIFFDFIILPLLFGISEASTSFTSDNPLHLTESKRGILMNKKGAIAVYICKFLPLLIRKVD